MQELSYLLFGLHRVINATGVLGVIQMDGEYEQSNRERKLESKRTRIKKHGKNIGVVYQNALEKRARGKERVQ